MRVDLSTGRLVVESGDPRLFRDDTSRVIARGASKPAAIVWHWTAGFGSARTLARAVRGGAGSSFHVGIDRDGTLTQLAPFKVGTFHCRGRFPAGSSAAGQGVNEASIGIELVNMGQLMLVDGHWLQVENPHEPQPRHKPTPGVPPVPAADVLEHAGAHWHNWPPAQVASALAVLDAVRRAYGIPASECGWGHVDLDPKRKADPGPAWLSIVRAHLAKGGA